jgi:hypothetical protein
MCDPKAPVRPIRFDPDITKQQKDFSLTSLFLEGWNAEISFVWNSHLVNFINAVKSESVFFQSTTPIAMCEFQCNIGVDLRLYQKLLCPIHSGACSPASDTVYTVFFHRRRIRIGTIEQPTGTNKADAVN